MLRFRLGYLMDSKGIQSPQKYLINMGFSPDVAYRFLHGKMEQPKLSQINKLCEKLKCTPNDLLEYIPSEGENNLPQDHPLLSMVRNDKPFHIADKLHHLSFDQIKEVEKFIAGIGNGKNTEG